MGKSKAQTKKQTQTREITEEDIREFNEALDEVFGPDGEDEEEETQEDRDRAFSDFINENTGAINELFLLNPPIAIDDEWRQEDEWDKYTEELSCESDKELVYTIQRAKELREEQERLNKEVEETAIALNNFFKKQEQELPDELTCDNCDNDKCLFNKDYKLEEFEKTIEENCPSFKCCECTLKDCSFNRSKEDYERESIVEEQKEPTGANGLLLNTYDLLVDMQVIRNEVRDMKCEQTEKDRVRFLISLVEDLLLENVDTIRKMV